MIQFAKNSINEKRQKSYVLLENTQTMTHALLKEKTPTEFFKVNLRVLNTLSKVKYIYIYIYIYILRRMINILV